MALSVGAKAPDFTLLNTNLEPVSLSSFAGKRVLLAFFPAAFTGVCEAELCRFQESMQQLNNAGVQVLAVSADLPWSNGGFAKANNLSFPLLSDWKMDAIRAYDVSWENFAGIEGLTRSARATFVIGADGMIEFVDVTENPGIEPDYAAILAKV
ncbi:MAG: peroxiredoxin [Bradyrhizobiaceae bacterium]|nr:peroxiredoxin [Bradyrhizobiaceae bacterium]